MMDSLVRAGREAGRVRVIAEVQARLVPLRLSRRSQRDRLAAAVLALYRKNAITDPELRAACRELDETEQEIEHLEAVMARARGDAPPPAAPVVTEITAEPPCDS